MPLDITFSFNNRVTQVTQSGPLAVNVSFQFVDVQGSVATVLRLDGQTEVICVTFLRDVACQKLLNSANVSRSYSQNNTGTVF